MDSTNYQSFLSNILFILVIYKINLDDCDSFKSLMESCEDSSTKIDVFIYDNSPSSLVSKNQTQHHDCNIHYVHDKTNPGVSKAYNEGCKLAKELDKKWLLLLDQDTKFENNALIKYYQSVNDNIDINLFAPILISSDSRTIYSPCRYLFNRGFSFKQIEVGKHTFKQKSVLNSGLLINTEIFGQVGGYNEKLKLDFSDFEFIDRYRKICNIFCVVNCTLTHELSSTEQDLEKLLNRFRIYCESSKIIAKVNFDTFILMCFVLLRACKLSIKFKNTEFLVLFSEIFLV